MIVATMYARLARREERVPGFFPRLRRRFS